MTDDRGKDRAQGKQDVSTGLASLGIPTPERLVFTQFAAMPLWVRVLTYLVFVAVAVHGYLVPRVVSGTVDVVEQDSKTHTAFSHGLVSVVGDRSERYYADGREDGTWSIPVPTQMPVGFELEFAEKENPQGREKLQVCATDVLLGHLIEIRYHPDGAGARFTRIDKNCRPPSDGGGGADDGKTFNLPSTSLISSAYAQGAPVARVSPPKDVARIVAGAVEGSASAGRSDAQVATEAASALSVDVTSTEAANVHSADQMSQLLQQKVYAKQIGDSASAVYLYAGDVDGDGNWAERPNVTLENKEAKPRPFRAGDLVSAQGQVNKRADYIQFTVFGWRNADSLGVAHPGDHFVVQDSKVIGNHVWVKAIPVELKQ